MKMLTLNLSTLAFGISLVLSGNAMAQAMSESDYKMGKEKISLEYKAAKTKCSSLSGNANDICVAEAKGQEKVGLAELENTYKPTPKHLYEARVTKAEADYAVAKQRCDDKSGNVKDVCIKEAKAAESNAKGEAKVHLKTSEANTKAGEKSADARQDASADKTDAQYAVAKEKCDAYAGEAKDRCLTQAKKAFGK